MSNVKLQQLHELLKSFGSCLVAYSGGVDSAFLALVARRVLGNKALAAIADTPSLPRRELQEALDLAETFQIPVRVVRTHEFDNPDYVANSLQRCYFCKQELFTQLVPLAKSGGYAVIVYGENASDIGDHRPGAQAAAEYHVRAPLKEVGLTKQEIRRFSAELGLPTADKPQMACLSSRIPPGEQVTPAKLKMVEEAEDILKDLGFFEIRVRHHELRSADPGYGMGKNEILIKGLSHPALPGPKLEIVRHLARIEIGLSELPKLVESDMAGRIVAALKEIGYAHVTVDLAGYRRGSFHELTPAPAKTKA